MKNKLKTRLFAFFLTISAHSFATFPKKPWTVIVYIAGDNDLAPFIARNIEQMEKIGSNENITIIAQINTSENFKRKWSKTILVGKNQSTILTHQTNPSLVDSGNPETLISFCTYAIETFPADNYALILWDHGTGPLDAHIPRRLRMIDLFSFEKHEKKNQNNIFLQNLLKIFDKKEQIKGICFDDTTRNSLSERCLKKALSAITQGPLKGKPFDLLGFDACLMATAEIASLVKDYAEIMVASQEVELGPGWDYGRVLAPFLFGQLSKESFGVHIVHSYEKTYQFTNDYTLSCVNLKKIPQIEGDAQAISDLLSFALSQNDGTFSTKKFILLSSNKQNCTRFEEPSFTDLLHFYKNLLQNIQMISLRNKKEEKIVKNKLFLSLSKGIENLNSAILANVSGPKHKGAHGLSIYLPERTIHYSYKHNLFSNNTKWLYFLQRYHS